MQSNNIQWAGRFILNVKCINQSIAMLSKKVPERAVSCNWSWSLLFINEYFHVLVKRQLISWLQEQIIVMSRLLVTKINLQICVYVWQKTCFTVVITGISACRAVQCDVTHVIAMQQSGATHGCVAMGGHITGLINSKHHCFGMHLPAQWLIFLWIFKASL